MPTVGSRVGFCAHAHAGASEVRTASERNCRRAIIGSRRPRAMTGRLIGMIRGDIIPDY
jgi:hypothetical protein